MRVLSCLVALVAVLTLQSIYGAGRQLTGVYTPTPTPALSPEEAQKSFIVPEGFEMRLFAAEPQVINPVAMTWDDRGRLWVLELFEYPLGAPAGAKPRDQIKILEDTDGDGRADKVTVFADGLNLATGLQLGNGGVYVGQAPHLLFLKDTNGDDRADERQVLMTGFGLEDRHELLNGFTWGPDGYLYMTHGVFTVSKVKDPNRPDDPPVTMTAAVARFQPRTKKFEVFAEGTSNPWGVDFDAAGNAFVSACVIDHLFHMAPGGIYQRQAGNSANPYAYELLPSIVEHKHFRAAYAGVQVYQGDQYPEDYRGTIFMGNIHDSAIHQDKLTPEGSSFKSTFIKDFVRSKDGWFRPVSTQTGPDGALWIMDWYDKYPCYQNANADPEGVDRERGRIWRVVYTGKNKGAPVPSHPANLNLGKLATPDLVKVLEHPNSWHRRMAQRLLSERHDPESKPLLEAIFKNGKTPEAQLAALWTLHSAGQLDSGILDAAAQDKDYALRVWAARLTGERGEPDLANFERLFLLAADDNLYVKVAVATAMRQFISGSLTVDTPPAKPYPGQAIAVVGRLITANTPADPLLTYMIWMASEPAVARAPGPVIQWLRDNGMKNPGIASAMIRKTMRRICDNENPAQLSFAVQFLDTVAPDATPLIIAALNGLIEGQKGRPMPPPGDMAAPVLAKLSKNENKNVAAKSQQLGALWGDAAAVQVLLNTILDQKKSAEERVQAIQAVRQQKTASVREALIKLLAGNAPEKVVQAGINALSEVGGDDLGDAILANWKNYSAATRRIAAEALTSRRHWAQSLLTAIEKKAISSSEIPAGVVRNLVGSKDDYIRNRAQAVIGRFRESQPDKLKLIAEKKQMILLGGPVDTVKGHELAQKTCFTCHKLYGEGADVGPDLTGVGRSTLDALLANVIDPNQIIGKGYENVEVETKDGRNVSGRVVEDTDSRIKLLSAGPHEEVVAKKDIESMRVSEMSVMPEGLEQMPDDDFRNLILYILNHPKDPKPAQGESKDKQSGISKTDGESVALWNPEWRIDAPDFEGSPQKLPEYDGKSNVLMTHPRDLQTGAILERTVSIPAGSTATLSFNVAAHERGDWELRVLANDLLLKKQTINRSGDPWKTVRIDLSQFAGKKVVLKLENCANNWEWEFGYWNDIKINIAGSKQTASN